MTEPLILLPGLLCDEALWKPQIDHFGARIEIRVADLTQGSTITDLAAGVLAAAPPRFALAGLSMGGYVAQEVMRQAPERVTRLALMDTSARADTDEQHVRREALIDLARRGRFKGVTPRLMPLLIHADRLTDETLTGIIMEMAERIGQAAFERQQRAILSRPDGRHDLSRIRCPTLVLCGADDALTPRNLSLEMATEIPNATLAVIEHCGHLSTLEQPALVNARLESWLAA